MGIKLRVRIAGSGETMRVEVPEVCTLSQLRAAVATKCFDGAVPPENVAVTLNRTDDVSTQGAGEGSTLRACGIARGDLVHVFVRDGPTAAAATTNAPADAPVASTSAPAQTDEEDRRRRCLHAAERRGDVAAAINTPAASTASHDTPTSPVDAAGRSGRGAPFVATRRPTPMPPALSSLLELREPADPVGLVACAVHASLVDAGMDIVDVTPCNIKRASFRPRWENGAAGASTAVPPPVTVVVRAQDVGGDHVVFAASVNDGDPFVFRCAASAHVVAVGAHGGAHGGADGGADGYADVALPSLWRDAKDSLALPASIRARTAAGLPSPPPLLALPDELKLAVLASLATPRDICAVGATCRELAALASSDALWKPLHDAEFGAETSNDVRRVRDASSGTGAFRRRYAEKHAERARRERERERRVAEMMRARERAARGGTRSLRSPSRRRRRRRFCRVAAARVRARDNGRRLRPVPGRGWWHAGVPGGFRRGLGGPLGGFAAPTPMGGWPTGGPPGVPGGGGGFGRGMGGMGGRGGAGAGWAGAGRGRRPLGTPTTSSDGIGSTSASSTKINAFAIQATFPFQYRQLQYRRLYYTHLPARLSCLALHLPSPSRSRRSCSARLSAAMRSASAYLAIFLALSIASRMRWF